MRWQESFEQWNKGTVSIHPDMKPLPYLLFNFFVKYVNFTFSLYVDLHLTLLLWTQLNTDMGLIYVVYSILWFETYFFKDVIFVLQTRQLFILFLALTVPAFFSNHVLHELRYLLDFPARAWGFQRDEMRWDARLPERETLILRSLSISGGVALH